ncbi:MAG: sulfite exporter TauE/SafE family protein [Bacteroidetes bacterium]|nr:sulfite exporter TauE/SafE family protein [Bacteroidota bacterium]
MLWSVLITGFTLGAVGSLHCVGMCGPLSLALPIHHLSKPLKLLALLLYQIGRVITYAIIGLIFGIAGNRIYIAGYQQWFSIGMGVMVLLLALLYFLYKKNVRVPLLNAFYKSVQQLIIKILKSSKRTYHFLLLGMANGLLPCGMVYIALASTFTLASVSESVAFMAMFGAGTLPAMMLVGFAGTMIKPEIRIAFKKLTPIIISVMGVILILRGLNLGIPFISPLMPQVSGEVVNCHP